ncbi:MAG: hypothetical protein J5711_09745 [Bacteroidales bacterium]|nr:hypothetical protein [Bacteroidales bacterium]
MRHLLSKSKYIRGLQCDRALWLDVFHPDLAQYSRETMRKFDRGREFERAFKDLFPDAVDVSAALGRKFDKYAEFTSNELSREGEVNLFEAGFFFDDVLVLADVVHKRADGTLDIYEVKSGSALSDTYRRDAALQHYVISHCQKINSFSIVYNGKLDKSDLSESSDQSEMSDNFKIVNLTAEFAAEHETIARNIAVMKGTISLTSEPDTPTGAHCQTPYECPYQQHCLTGIRDLSLF